MRDRFGDDDVGLWDDPRRRATVILLILAMTAALIVAIMIFFVGTSPSHRNTGLDDVGPTTPATQTPSHAATTKHSGAPAGRTASTSAAPKPTSTANPCPSAKPCPVPGDNGGAVAALIKFRTGHGMPAVAGIASAQAQQCALGQGSGPTCQPHYAWQPVPTQDGVQAINKMAQRDGGKWLLDPAMSSFSVGWAYLPGPGGGPGQYSFVVLKIG